MPVPAVAALNGSANMQCSRFRKASQIRLTAIAETRSEKLPATRAQQRRTSRR